MWEWMTENPWETKDLNGTRAIKIDLVKGVRLCESRLG